MQEIIIIRWPFLTPESRTITSTTKKEVSLFFWHNHIWHQEKKEILWHETTSTNIHNLINNLFILLEEEQIMPKKTSVQSVLIAPSGRTAYVSFDQSPFLKNHITYEKWLIIEGILKTIRENSTDIDTIQFLVRHTPFHDQHLDFSKPWPITGFHKQLQ